MKICRYVQKLTDKKVIFLAASIAILLALSSVIVFGIVRGTSASDYVSLNDVEGRRVWEAGSTMCLDDLLSNVLSIARSVDEKCYLSSPTIKGNVDKDGVHLQRARFVFARPIAPPKFRSMIQPFRKWTKFLVIDVNIVNGVVDSAYVLTYGGKPEGEYSGEPLPFERYAAFLPKGISIKKLEGYLEDYIRQRPFDRVPSSIEVSLPVRGGAEEPSYYVILEDPILRHVHEEMSVPAFPN